MDAVEAATSEVPMGRLEAALAKGSWLQAEAALEDVFGVLEDALYGGSQEQPRGSLLVAKAADSLPQVIGSTMAAGAEAVPLCAPPQALDLWTPLPKTEAAALQMRGALQGTADALKKLKVNVKLPPTAQMNPKTEKGRAMISRAFNSMNSALRALEKLEEQGIGFAGRKSVKLKFKPDTRGPQITASADQRKSTVFVNTKSELWLDRQRMQDYSDTLVEGDWHPSVNPDSTMVHEFGHIKHYWSMDEKFEAARDVGLLAMDGKAFAAGEELIAREVSRYATTNRLEFIAETFSGIVDGKRYSSRVMDLYWKLLGPEVTA